MGGRITGLYIYPVKSCRGISLTEMEIGPTGPVHDRQWMLVDSENKFITLRTVSKMAEIKTALQGSFLHLYAGSNKILVNYSEPCETAETVTVWKDSFLAGIENKSINEALSDFLSKTVKLVRYGKKSHRSIGAYATSVVQETMFADAHPILLVNENSLRDLNSKLKGEKSVIERFRANIIVDGLPVYAEDEAKQFKIGSLTFTNPKPCGRCPVITQDIETGKVVSKETLQLLASERQIPGTSKVPFGVNLTPAALGFIRIGDSVELS